MTYKKSKKTLFQHRKRRKADELPKRLREHVHTSRTTEEPGCSSTVCDAFLADHNYCVTQEKVAEHASKCNPLVETETLNCDAASPCPQSPTQSPSNDESVAELSDTVWSDLVSSVTASLPSNWILVQDGNVLQISMMSVDSPKVIQRSISMSSTGNVEVSVHGCELESDHKIFLELPKFPVLSEHTVNQFSKCTTLSIACVRQMEICVGANIAQFSHLWKKMKSAYVDNNLFKEPKFLISCRSNQCKFLVSQQSLRCTSCASLQRVLRNRFTRSEKAKQGTPNKNKADKYLTTPEAKARETRRKKTTRNVKLQNTRLREKIDKVLEQDGVHIDEDLNTDLSGALKGKGISDFQKKFIQQQVKTSQAKSACGRRWHPAMIRMALDIFLHSPTTYDVVRRYITLPSQRTLFDYSHLQQPKEGICMDTINEMSVKIEAMSEYQSYHILYFDEIFISKNLVYSKSTGEIVGYCKLSEVDEEVNELQQLLSYEQSNSEIDHRPPLATKILSFMCNGVSSGLCEVVASYTVSTLNKEDLFEKHWSVVEALEMSGIRVTAGVGDGSSVNRSFFQMHQPLTQTVSGIIFDTENMYAEGRPFYFISDPPHLVKTIRNCFCSTARNLWKNNQFIKWASIHRLYHSTKRRTLKKAFQLNASAVFLTSYSRMRVGYAAQVMSKTVANALRQTKWDGIEETITFIEMVNTFFDCLNGNYSSEGFLKRKEELKPYRSIDDERFNFLSNFLEYLEDWKKEVDALPLSTEQKARRQLSRQTLDGIEITIRAFIAGTRYLLNAGTKFIMGRVFCQDHLEHYFSRQRPRCGGSNNPNSAEFFRNQNNLKLMGKVGVKRSRSNVQVRDSQPNTDCTPMPKRKTSCRKSLEFDKW